MERYQKRFKEEKKAQAGDYINHPEYGRVRIDSDPGSKEFVISYFPKNSKHKKLVALPLSDLKYLEEDISFFRIHNETIPPVDYRKYIEDELEEKMVEEPKNLKAINKSVSFDKFCERIKTNTNSLQHVKVDKDTDLTGIFMRAHGVLLQDKETGDVYLVDSAGTDRIKFAIKLEDYKIDRSVNQRISGK